MKLKNKIALITGAACLLASDESSYINGECLKVDSGRSVRDAHDY